MINEIDSIIRLGEAAWQSGSSRLMTAAGATLWVYLLIARWGWTRERLTGSVPAISKLVLGDHLAHILTRARRGERR